VEGLTCRLLPFAVADGPLNMASDEVMLHAALDGTASLRFYGWSPPTLSLGYFQPEAVRQGDPLLAALPFVRRPSGGESLVHDHEVTYALALPPGAPWQSRVDPWLARMHAVIAAALRELGILTDMFDRLLSGRLRDGAIDTSAGAPPRGRPLNENPLCFQHFTSDDLILNGAKVVGSAQRKHRGALLQHGAILLQRSAHTPGLPGIFELTGRNLEQRELAETISDEFSRETGWVLASAEWTGAENEKIKLIADMKYCSDAWNHKR
jgi:lipoate-protein ligase A